MQLATPQVVLWAALRIHTISCSCISIAGWGCSVECAGDKTLLSVTFLTGYVQINIWHWFVAHRYPGFKRALTKWETLPTHYKQGLLCFLLLQNFSLVFGLCCDCPLLSCLQSHGLNQHLPCAALQISASVTGYWVNTAPFHLSLVPLGTNKQKEDYFFSWCIIKLWNSATGCCGGQN